MLVDSAFLSNLWVSNLNSLTDSLGLPRIQGILTSTGQINLAILTQLPDSQRALVSQAFAEAFPLLWYISAGIACIGVIAIALCEHIPLRTQIVSNIEGADKPADKLSKNADNPSMNHPTADEELLMLESAV